MTKNNLLSEKLNYIGESETPTHLHVSSYNAEQIQTFTRTRYKRYTALNKRKLYQLDTSARITEYRKPYMKYATISTLIS